MIMSHTIKHKSKLVGRVRRIKGQLEAVERALESELGCADVLMLVASKGTRIKVHTSGEDAEPALAALSALVRDKFGEH